MFWNTGTARAIGARVMDKVTGGVPLTAGYFGPEAIPVPEAINQVVAEISDDPRWTVHHPEKLHDAVRYAWLYLSNQIASAVFTAEEKHNWESEVWIEEADILKRWASRRRVRQTLREGNEALGRLIVAEPRATSC